VNKVYPLGGGCCSLCAVCASPLHGRHSDTTAIAERKFGQPFIVWGHLECVNHGCLKAPMIISRIFTHQFCKVSDGIIHKKKKEKIGTSLAYSLDNRVKVRSIKTIHDEVYRKIDGGSFG
jgi:hypothetical protein